MNTNNIMSPIPSWLLQSSAFLRETEDSLNLEDIPTPVPLTADAMAELKAFVDEGTLVWSTRFWKLVSYFMIDGWASALDKHIRHYGTGETAVVVEARIGKSEDWPQSFTCEMESEEIWRKGLFFRLPDTECWLWAKHGHLDCLQWARGNGCPWDVETCAYAALSGNLECLQWAHENGCPWDTYTCALAAMMGHLDCLQWAHENGCPWNSRTCVAAVENGHLDCLKWAHENGCPWDTRTCALAAMTGNLDCLQWAHENGCPWDTWTCALAAMTGKS